MYETIYEGKRSLRNQMYEGERNQMYEGKRSLPRAE